MNKKILSLILVSLISLQTSVNAADPSVEKEASEKSFFNKHSHYFISGSVLAAGSASAGIAYFSRKDLLKKIELLKTAEAELNINIRDLNDIYKKEVFEFAESLNQSELLEEIIKKKETMTQLRKKLFWANLFFFGGLLAAGGATLATGAMIYKDVSDAREVREKEKRERKNKKRRLIKEKNRLWRTINERRKANIGGGPGKPAQKVLSSELKSAMLTKLNEIRKKENFATMSIEELKSEIPKIIEDKIKTTGRLLSDERKELLEEHLLVQVNKILEEIAQADEEQTTYKIWSKVFNCVKDQSRAVDDIVYNKTKAIEQELKEVKDKLEDLPEPDDL